MLDRNQPWTDLLSSYRNRRRAVQSLAAVAGSVLLLKAAVGERGPFVLAQEDGDGGENSGRGDAGSGHGGADRDESEQVPVTGQVPQGAIEVRIVDDEAGGFVPGELTVDLGQTVAFVNAHSDAHTATGSGFDTGVIASGQVATVVLDTAGKFAYACQIHPVMTGSISVRGEDGVVPQAQAVQEVPAGATPVRIVNLSFDPAEVTVSTGTAVSWANDDTVPHTVTSTDGIFDSGIFDPGGNFSWTFDQPGSFPYRCQLHPQMQGTVIAEGEAVASASQGSAAGNESEQSSQPSAASTPTTTADTAVSIVDFAFEAATLEAQAGTTVVWTNNGQVPHTVTGDFADSGVLEPGQTFSHTFSESGEFRYACAIHPIMTGTIRVSAAAAAESTPAASPAPDGTTFAGVWLIRLTPDNEDILGEHQGLITFHEDGTADADFSAESGNGAATTVLSSGRGEWMLQGTVCRLSLIALMKDAEQRFAGTAKVEAEAQLDTTGRALDGTFEFTVVSAGGQSLGDGSGTLSGESVPLAPSG